MIALIWTLALLLLGIFLSGFFSGSETGFYRASRVRIVIASLDGDRMSKALVKLINNPALFVATTLIGNNVANYVTSLAIVLLARLSTASCFRRTCFIKRPTSYCDWQRRCFCSSRLCFGLRRQCCGRSAGYSGGYWDSRQKKSV